MDQEDEPFQLEEATIAEMHEAIRSGKTTLLKIVQRYIDRARAYNGVSSLLLTEDGAAVPEVVGVVRATSPPRFPTETVKAAAILPDLDKYRGPPLEFGRMESTCRWWRGCASGSAATRRRSAWRRRSALAAGSWERRMRVSAPAKE